MIKIKNNIINENKIIQISINEDNNLEIDIEHSFPIVIKNANFSDIEWNYENNNEYCNVFYEDRIKELKEEKKNMILEITKREEVMLNKEKEIATLEEKNKKLKDELETKDFNYTKFRHLEESNDILKEELEESEEEVDKLEDRINKAIDYIKTNTYSVYDKETTLYEDVIFADKLLKLLKGEEE